LDDIININNESRIKNVYEKIINRQRVSNEDALYLYEYDNLFLLGYLANIVKERLNGRNVYYNKNIHVEPTNNCVYNCKFCSYSARISGKSWILSEEKILANVLKYKNSGITEVHITGGVYRLFDLNFYCNLFAKIKQEMPDLHIKALSAVEIKYLADIHNVNFDTCIKQLKNAGLNSIPGGGAEIFDESIREVICGDKANAKEWLDIHRAVHLNGLYSNATMLYGHLESYANRVGHLEKLRLLQDETNGFKSFIPLKFKNKNNALNSIVEATNIEDLKNYAVSRIYLDNFSHVKAYWPMIGIDMTMNSLYFGVDDIDGTIDNTTKIYEMAGVSDRQGLTEIELINYIKREGFVAVERDSNYNILKIN